VRGNSHRPHISTRTTFYFMKILIYGFKPYKHFQENITEKIIRKISNRAYLKKAIFPVKFERDYFLKRIKRIKPAVILGLGQNPRGRKIGIERKAINSKQYNKERPEIIYKNKPKHYFVNLKLKKDKNSWISYDAGKQVCNFSMYIISDFLKNKRAEFAFLHIPKNYNLKRAIRFVENKIDEIIERKI